MAKPTFRALTRCIVLVLLLVLLLPSLSMTSALPVGRVAAAQSSSSCPANETLKAALNGGAPNSFALLNAATSSAFDMTFSEYYGVYPAYYPQGGSDYNMSLVDWINSNSNYTQWTFNVKPGMKWSNGQNVTSQDILATYSNKYAFNSSYDFTGVHKEVVSESPLNSSAAVFNLNKPDAHFPETISQLVLTNVVPASMVNEYGQSFTGFEPDSSAVGPFYPANYTLGQTQMTLLRNPNFNPKPIACQLDLTFVEATSQAVSLLKGGSVDLAPVDPASVPSLLSNPNLHIIIQNASEITTLDYNVTTYPFNMTSFRQALLYGIDENQLVLQGLAGYGEAAYAAEGTVPPDIASLYNPGQVSYKYNTTKAMALLNSIGMTLVNGHLQYPNGTAVSVTLWGDDSFTYDSIISGLVQTDLQNLGITVNLQLTTYGNQAIMTSLPAGTITENTGGGVVFPDASVDAEPGWDVYVLPGIANQHWEYPPSADAQYQSNLTAIQNTSNQTLVRQYLDNIQALNAQYLPTITLDYTPLLWGYSTQRWTNWTAFPAGWVHMNANWDNLQLANLVPVGYTSSSTSTATSQTLATSSAPSTTTTTSTTSSSGSSVALGLPAILIAALVIVVLGASMAARRTRE